MKTPDIPLYTHRIDRGSVIKIPPISLLESVSWLSTQNRAITLGEWMAAHTPTVAQKFGLKPILVSQPIPDIPELTEVEARALVITRLVRRNFDQGISDGSTYADYLREVIMGSEKGGQVISAELSSIGQLQGLAYAGKLEPSTN